MTPSFADLLHGLGNDLPNGLVIVRRDRADLSDHFAGDGLGQFVEFAVDAVAFFVEFAGDDGDGLLDAALQGHGIGAGCDGLDAFAVDGLSENGGGGGAVAGDVGSLGSDFANHLRAHILEAVAEARFPWLR